MTWILCILLLLWAIYRFMPEKALLWTLNYCLKKDVGRKFYQELEEHERLSKEFDVYYKAAKDGDSGDIEAFVQFAETYLEFNIKR